MIFMVSTIAVLPAVVQNEIALAAAGNSGPNRPNFVPGTLLIKFKNGVPDDIQQQTLDRFSVTSAGEIPQLGIKIIKMPEPALDAIQASLENTRLIEYVERDLVFEPEVLPNDPYYSKQWHLGKIGAPSAWDTGKGDGIVIAVLDSGVQASHPDLAGKLLEGYNFYDNNSDWSGSNVSCKHGTIVAGVAGAATNNGAGVASVSWNSKIMPLRVTDTSCYGYASAMAKAITHATDHGAKVANISFRIPELPQALSDAAKYMYNNGGLVVISSGNDAARYAVQNNPYVIHVGATESSDLLAAFSNYGPFVDFVAPGHAVYTSIYDGMYNYVSGTSFSAPVVSAAAALMFSAKPQATPSEVYDALKKSAVDLGPSGYDEKYGWGRINVAGAMKELTTSQTSTDTLPPTVTTPPDMIVEADSSAGKTVSYPAASATDNVAVTSGPVCTPASGNVFSLGTTTIVCSASDSAGNIGIDSFSISVRDTTPPSLTVPADISVKATQSNGATVTYDVSAQDLVDGSLTTYCNHASGSLFPIGVTLVSCSSTDDSGNTGADTFSVTVSSPVDTAPPSVAILNPAAAATVVGTVTISAVADDDWAVSKLELYINNKLKASTAGAALDFAWNTKSSKDGSYTLKVIAYDELGNKATVSVTVQVSNRAK